MNRNWIAGVTLATAGVSLAAAAGAADLAAGEASYKTCVACHGVDGAGNKALNAPVIGGWSTWYVERQLSNFKAGIRGTHEKDVYGAQMRPMSMTLADEEAIANVAAYVATLAPPAPEPTIEGDAEKGKQLYATCTACHGPDGQGMEALNAPRLAGQHDWYLVTQLKNYKAGIRGAHEKDVYGAQMRPMSMTLADEEAIRNVAAYIATLD